MNVTHVERSIAGSDNRQVFKRHQFRESVTGGVLPRFVETAYEFGNSAWRTINREKRSCRMAVVSIKLDDRNDVVLDCGHTNNFAWA